MSERPKVIVNVDELELQPRPELFRPTGDAAERYDVRSARLGPVTGMKRLGFNVSAVPPGRSAFPAHAHRVNDELFYVISGTGEARIGDAKHPVRAGDLFACPAGGPETAHQLLNTGTEDLVYLAISSTLSPEVVEYPDSGKFGVLALFGDDPSDMSSWFRYIGRRESAVDYWEGE
ncbi:MAG: cupin domain-containing protein [Planctomycetota bacterium]